MNHINNTSKKPYEFISIIQFLSISKFYVSPSFFAQERFNVKNKTKPLLAAINKRKRPVINPILISKFKSSS